MSHVVHKERRQQNDHDQQNGVFEICQRLELFVESFFVGILCSSS